MKFKTWEGNDLEGRWVVSYKIDGVRAVVVTGNNVVLSRAGKPLYNLDHLELKEGHYEVFIKSWEDTITAVRTHSGQPVSIESVYSLDPLDERLLDGIQENPTAETIRSIMAAAIEQGYEGLVLRQDDIFLKVKPIETYDVVVEDTYPGEGKHEGRIGGVITAMGRVGTGFTDEQRERTDWKGLIVEVECMGLTPNGKFRHPRFKRVRVDK